MSKDEKEAIEAMDKAALWRDECAMRAMQGLLAGRDGVAVDPVYICREAFRIANEMLKTRDTQEL